MKRLFIILLLYCNNVYALPGYEKISRLSHIQTVYETVRIASDAYKLDVPLILSVMYIESKFKVDATNGKNVGLMQVNLYWHSNKFPSKTKKSYYSIYNNVFVGTGILKDCMVKHNNVLNKALRCYNGNGDPLYVPKVMRALRFYQSEYMKGKA